MFKMRMLSGQYIQSDNNNSGLLLYIWQSSSRIIRSLGIEALSHPPYIPDLDIYDFWLFPVMKDMLCDKKHGPKEERAVAITKSLREISRDGLEHVFRTWTDRWQNCICCKGRYLIGSSNLL